MAFQHWGESEYHTTACKLFSSNGCGKTPSFLIDVVVPRKVHEVHDLLVIAYDTPKAALVTSFGPAFGYRTVTWEEMAT